MKKAPCVRFASLIKPKMSENPEESRKSRPPSDRLLRPWMIQNCIVCRSRPVSPARIHACSGADLLLQVLRRRIIARINGVLQELGLVIGPELRDIGISLDHGIDQSPVGFCHFADVDISNRITKLVELDDAPDRLGAAAADSSH